MVCKKTETGEAKNLISISVKNMLVICENRLMTYCGHQWATAVYL